MTIGGTNIQVRDLLTRKTETTPAVRKQNAPAEGAGGTDRRQQASLHTEGALHPSGKARAFFITRAHVHEPVPKL